MKRIFRFYVDGFREMTIGKTLWAIILIKLFILFAIMKLLFFPNALKDYSTPQEKADRVWENLVSDSATRSSDFSYTPEFTPFNFKKHGNYPH